MVRLGIVGCGYWGANYVRVFHEIPDARVALACDLSEQRLGVVGERFPGLATCRDWREVAADPEIDAVVVATSASTHCEIAEGCLERGKHVLVEKPLATTVADAGRLVRRAESSGRVLVTGHTFLFNSGILKVRDLIQDSKLGALYYLRSTRTNMGPFRDDVSAFWDLGSHDVSIFNFLLGDEPRWVSAVGARPLNRERPDAGFATLGYAGEILGHIHVSWVDPHKERQLVVVGSQRRILFDDLESLEQVRIFEKGVSTMPEVSGFGEHRLLVQDGDIVSPRIEAREPLKNLARYFQDRIAGRVEPISDGPQGAAVVRVIEALDRSLAEGGRRVAVE